MRWRRTGQRAVGDAGRRGAGKQRGGAASRGRLLVFAVNRTKRLMKAPKLCWCDTTFALHLAGESEPRGAHLENLVPPLADSRWRGADSVIEQTKRLLNDRGPAGHEHR